MGLSVSPQNRLVQNCAVPCILAYIIHLIILPRACYKIVMCLLGAGLQQSRASCFCGKFQWCWILGSWLWRAMRVSGANRVFLTFSVSYTPWPILYPLNSAWHSFLKESGSKDVEKFAYGTQFALLYQSFIWATNAIHSYIQKSKIHTYVWIYIYIFSTKYKLFQIQG